MSEGLRAEGLTVVIDGGPGGRGPSGGVLLDAVSVSVEPGEVLAVLGRSGAGKSTLLRAIAGLIPLAAGQIEIDGVDVTSLPTHRRGLGLMFQHPALFPHLDVGENVAYGLKVRGSSRTARAARTEELLDRVGLGGFARRSVADLSGGEAQRVALARALAPNPRVLMLDEPLAALDRPRRADLLDEVRRVLQELSQAAVYVTHDRDEAFALATSIIVLDEGRAVRQGRPADVWSDPGSVRVAELLGHRNLVTPAVLRGAVGSLPTHLAGASQILVPHDAVTLGGDIAGYVISRHITFDQPTAVVELSGGARLSIAYPASGPTSLTVGIRVDRLVPLRERH